MTGGYQRKWETRRGGRSAGDEALTTYYGAPVIKAPHWNWLIVLYFFLGGISSASHVIACIAELIGGPTNRQITRVARYLSFVTLVPSPFLLIFDLGRPERFFYMLRVLKLRSPMSVGTWGLSIYGVFCATSTLIQAAHDGLLNWLPPVKRLLLALPHKLLNVVGSFFGFFVGGYTGVLLGITAIPVWAKNHLLLGPLFLSSAVSSASAAITLVLSLLPQNNHKALKRLERIDLVARVAEASLLLATRLNLGPVLARPLRRAPLKHVFRWGVLGAGIVLPVLAQLRAVFGASRGTSIVASLSTLAGGYCLRHLMVYLGRASAADPEATFEFTRRR